MDSERGEGYYGRESTFPFGKNVHEVPAEGVKALDVDIVLFQTAANYERDQYEVLSAYQRALPKFSCNMIPLGAIPRIAFILPQIAT